MAMNVNLGVHIGIAVRGSKINYLNHIVPWGVWEYTFHRKVNEFMLSVCTSGGLYVSCTSNFGLKSGGGEGVRNPPPSAV